VHVLCTASPLLPDRRERRENLLALGAEHSTATLPKYRLRNGCAAEASTWTHYVVGA
jgi:hypothetical protein